MAELNSHVYVRQTSAKEDRHLESVIQAFSNQGLSSDVIESTLVSTAREYDKLRGEDLAVDLIASVKKEYGDTKIDLDANVQEIAGYYRLHFCHGSRGHEIIPAIILFLGELLTNSDVRGYLEGDDDPWEMFYVYKNSKVIEKDYEPDHSERSNDQLPEEYLWWHAGMPESISEGFINRWKAVDDDEWEDW